MIYYSIIPYRTTILQFREMLRESIAFRIISRIFCVVFLIQQLLPTTEAVWKADVPPRRASEEKLRKDLLSHYDPKTRDSRNESTIVNLALVINNIHLDYHTSVFTVTGLLTLIWKDKRLTWQAKDYEQLSDTRMGKHEVWRPDIALYNGAGDCLIDERSPDIGINIDSNGQLVWSTPVSLRTLCVIDLSNWPFDRQHCYLKLGSWTQDGNELDIRSNDSDIQITTGYGFSSEWKIDKLDYSRNVKKYNCCEEPYIDVTYNMTMKRKQNNLGSFTLAPSFVLTLILFSIFWMPPQCSEKFLLAGVVQITSCLILTYFCDQVPITTSNLPLIIKYYTNLFSLTTIYVFISIIGYNMSDAQFRCVFCPPTSVMELLKTRFASYLIQTSELNSVDVTSRLSNVRFPSGDYDVSEDSVRIDTERQSVLLKLYGSQWYLLFIVIERSIFLFYVLFFLISYCKLLIRY